MAADPFSTLGAIACTRTGWCAAGGSYRDRAGHVLATAAIESGRWAGARRLAMPAGAVPAFFAGSQEVRSIWCSRPAACVAAGSYQTAVSSSGFVAAESGGTWTRALELRLPGNASSIAPGAVLGGVSCRAAGACVTVGSYLDRSLAAEAMAAARSRGRWAPARELRLPAGAAADPGADLSSVWCPAASACLAVGGYQTATSERLGLAAAGSPGRWRVGPIPLPPNAAAGSGLNSDVYAAVSCIPARFCVTAGSYMTRSGSFQPATATMSAGHWTARQMPLPAGAAADPMAALGSVSCAATFCQAVGWFTLRSGAELPMTIRRASGRWGPVSLAPLPANARAGADQSASLAAVTCTQAGRCTAAGSYLDTAGRRQAMVATRL